MKTVKAAILATLLLATPAVFAGELGLAWAPSQDDVTAGYDVEVLPSEGDVPLRVEDVEAATTYRVYGLEDGQVYRFRVRPYDIFGQRADEPSAEIVTMPAPRIDALSVEAQGEGRFVLTLEGANFASGARLVPRRDDLRVLGSEITGHTRLVATVAWTGAGALLPRDFLVANAVRRSDAFIAAHPELLDVDGSGAIDEADAASVKAAFGVRAGDARYDEALDVNGNGVVDGEDLSAIRAKLGDTGLLGEQ